MNVQNVMQAAMSLPLAERAQLAEKLLTSLDDMDVDAVEQQWLLEAQRRCEQIDRNEVRLVDADEVERRVAMSLK